MAPAQLLLRCFADRNEFGWQAFCLDLDLAAQGGTFEEARARLSDMIVEYVHDAMVGEHQEYADVLLTRKAPLSLWARYWWYQLRSHVRRTTDGMFKTFRQKLPLQVAPI